MNENSQKTDDRLYRTLVKAILFAAAIYVLLWFLDATITVILIFIAAFMLAIALNAPVQWLEKHKVPRPIGALVMLLLSLGAVALVLWLVIPEVTKQVSTLAEKLPEITKNLQSRSSAFISRYPEVQQQIGKDGFSLESMLPDMQTAILRVGRYTLSLVGAILFGVILLTIVLYSLVKPRPLLRGVLEFMPEGLRGNTERALSRGSESVVAWVWSNIIIGGIEGLATGIFCQLMGVPGAFVWGMLAFFSELVPQIGVYLVSIPVLLVALSVSPMTALWTLLFFVALNQVTSNFISPIIVGKTMKLHPVSILFAVLALGSAFGFLGAVLAMPLAGFIKAIYDEFYGKQQPAVEAEDEMVEKVLNRETEEG